MVTKIGVVLGVIAGILFIITGILTALKITPSITAEGLEVSLGIWRIFAGIVVIGSSLAMKKYKQAGIITLALGLFEVLVFFVEKDYSILTVSPFIAIFAGIFGLLRK